VVVHPHRAMQPVSATRNARETVSAELDVAI
jgi:hypothetical protein